MLSLRNDVTVFGKLLTRGDPSDAILYRHRWEQGLSQFDAQPSGMPRRAILVVRKLRLNPPRGPEGWRQCTVDLKTQLTSQLRSAVRMRRGAFGYSSPNAILFEDEPDLLASIASDWCRGELQQRWWWRDLLRGREPDLQFWFERVESLPAAMVRLQQEGLLPRFTTALGENVREALVHRLVASFSLTSIARVLHDAKIPSASTKASDMPIPALRISGLFEEIGILIATSPNVVRSENYAVRLSVRLAVHVSYPCQTPVDHQTPSPSAAPPPLTRKSEEKLSADPSSPDRQQPVDRTMDPVQSTSSSTIPQQLSEPEAIPSAISPASLELQEISSPHNASLTAPTSFGTQYGGAFCLVNVLLYLGLYQDFTLTAAHPIEGPFWPLLYELAKRLLGSQLNPEDPLTAAVDRWTGCDIDSAFANAPRPPAWKVPDDWLPPLEGTPPIVFVTCERWPDWIDNLAAYLRVRIHRAVASETSTQSIALLIARPARVSETATTLDIEFPLRDLPFPVRAAGLDRDPGWVPAAGKEISFHYL